MPFIPGTAATRRGGRETTVTSNGALTNGALLNGATLLAPIAEDLTAVESAIQAVADVDSPHLRQTLRLILSAGGKRIRPMRVAALALLGVTVAKIFVVDMKNVQAVWRILSFIALGSLLLGVSYLYHRQLLRGGD